ncbi:hypothetical protein [Pseudomonas baetica]|uniref:hypothetical protein n=1 Tax=Pseudomonas baetica TaxID=674054 RepID=UPI0024051953|nr:hypothetical protein [Pseudomonas baetica]MDF9773664.1 hypothetical protein [Pseudomonas baetica]
MTSKTKDVSVASDEPIPATPAARCTFRDTLYTSRVLVLLEVGRTLKVKKGQVAVASEDTVALEYLQGRKDFVAVEG